MEIIRVGALRTCTRYIIFTLLALFMPLRAAAQEIVSMRIDTTACLGDTVPVSIGFDPTMHIVIQDGVATMGSDSREFLPDGVICDGKCSYESPVTFTDFATDAYITSVNDILYVRLKIEHSFIGDIYMGIKCPNGQRASLMNWAGTGSSPCTDSVPASHRGWNTDYDNTSGGTFLGLAYDYTDATNKCDSTTSNNQPGTGWNYCWSNNTTYGYSYAPLDGRIYRSVNANYFNASNRTIDSSDVAAGTNFYHPDQNFSSLIGCPLNGQWTIEVIDAYSQDNGYIFEWEMAIDPSLLPTAFSIDSMEVIGSQVIAFSDSVFGVTAPDSADGDSIVPYLVLIYTNHGDTIDTVFNVHYYAPNHTYINDTLCSGDTAWWLGQPYTTDTLIFLHTVNSHGCDSIIHVQYTFLPSYDLPDTLRYCRYGEFLYEGVDYGGPAVFDAPHMAVNGCDSMVHVVLEILDSTFGLHMMVGVDDLWSADTLLHGCQPFMVNLWDTTHLVASREWRLGDSDTAYTDSTFSHLYDTLGTFDVTLTAISVNGCTDTATMKRAINVYPVPKADFDWHIRPPAIHDPQTQFINLSVPDTIAYLWEIETMPGGATDTTSQFAPLYRWGQEGEVGEAGDYTVTLIAYWYHAIPNDTIPLVCTDTAVQAVTIVNDFLQFPNLVSPNGDGVNDIWRIVNLLEWGVYPDNELWIFNQWGIQVYHVKDIHREEDFWDPNATSCPDGTYFYRFLGGSIYGGVKRNGTIEVIRGQ